MTTRHALALAAALALPAAASQADGLIAFEEIGGNVVVTLSGTLSVPGDPIGIGIDIDVTDPLTDSIAPEIPDIPTIVPLEDASVTPSGAGFSVFGDEILSVYDVVGPTSFGSGVQSFGTSDGETTPLELNGEEGFLALPVGLPGMFETTERNLPSMYETLMFQIVLSGQVTFFDAGFDDLGIEPGTYTYDIVNPSIFVALDSDANIEPLFTDSLTVSVSTAAVPLPAGGLLLIGGLGALAIARRRRHTAQA